MVKNNELKDQEKEKEIENEKNNKNAKKSRSEKVVEVSINSDLGTFNSLGGCLDCRFCFNNLQRLNINLLQLLHQPGSANRK